MLERVVYGVGPVRELVRRRAREISIVYVSRARKGRDRDPAAELVREAKSRGIAVQERGRSDLDRLSGVRQHQGVVAIAGEYEYVDLEDLLPAFSANGAAAGALPLVVALDGVCDPRNLGAIIRSAYLFGASGVILPRDRSAQVTPVVTKTSAGATEHMAIAQVTNLARALSRLKEAGLWLCALAPGPEARALADIDARVPLGLVLGAEGAGIRPLVLRTCDFRAAIAMAAPGVGSLNVSVAAGVALYEIARQRAAGPEDVP